VRGVGTSLGVDVSGKSGGISPVQPPSHNDL